VGRPGDVRVDARTSTYAKIPYRGKNKPESQNDANRAHAKLRSPGERANAQLKNWRILSKLRCEREMAAVPADQRGRFQVNLAIVRLMLAARRGDLPAVVEESQRLLAPGGSADAALPGRCQDLRALALVSLGTAELWTLRANEAERHLDQGVALAR
jgi:hypothetical protein